jgi:hypothetical protein
MRTFYNRRTSERLSKSINLQPLISISFAGGDVDLYGYAQINPVNWVDPLGLQAATIVPGGLPLFIPPGSVFDPGSKANNAFVNSTLALLKLIDPRLPLDATSNALNQEASDLIQQIQDEAKKKLQNSKCETRVPDGNLPGQKHDPNNKTPDPNDPLWKKLIWIVGKLIQLYSKWPH